MDRVQELIDLLKDRQSEDRPQLLLWTLRILAAICVIAGIAYAVYRFFAPEYLEDFDDDFEDDFDNYFEDEDLDPAPQTSSVAEEPIISKDAETAPEA